MSIESEDMLEDALRSDFPTPDAQARIRRRLLAAGVAVGNGIATTAAASGAGAATTGVAAKVAGLSWGLKVGLAAVVAIPTVGLWLDGHAERRRAVPAPVATSAQTPQAQLLPIALAPVAPLNVPTTETEDAAPAPPPAEPRAAKAAVADATSPSHVMPSRTHPSQGSFAAAEAPARAPQAGSTLAEETRLLDGAFAELAAGHRARAAELIHEHEARFPAGLLQKERERARTRLSEMSRGE